jgi:hypothetical protein
MKRLCILSLSLVLPACSGDDSTPPADTGNGDASVVDSSLAEDTGSTQEDAGTRPDTGVTPTDSGMATTDSGESDAGSADAAADADAGPEVDASCPATWFEVPTVDPSIAVPDGGGGVLLHAIGTGTQNYQCLATTPSDGGATSYAWTLITPSANLTDCHANLVAIHFASEGGANFPEWESPDGGDYVIGAKHMPTFTPDGGSGSIAWLLLNAVDAGGAGTLSMARYIQRLDTDGGIAPSASTCNGASADAGLTADVPYTADYYFYGP